jgi:RNA polymerase sigma factor (sigma-70 family)
MSYLINIDYVKATNNQLMAITGFDRELPIDFVDELAQEMVKRGLWIGLIQSASKRAYGNLRYVRKNILRLDWEDLIQHGHIEIVESARKYIPGRMTLKTFLFMCLVSMFNKLREKAEAEKRKSDLGTTSVDELPEIIFCSHQNVERFVINKILFEEGCLALRDVERRAVTLWILGNTMSEVGIEMGYKKSTAKTLIIRAFKKLRAQSLS